MGKIYKRKLRSCKMCKPHKMGWAPKETKRQMQEREMAEKEFRYPEANPDEYISVPVRLRENEEQT